MAQNFKSTFILVSLKKADKIQRQEKGDLIKRNPKSRQSFAETIKGITNNQTMLPKLRT